MKKKKQKFILRTVAGFSIVEVLLSLFILSAGLTTVIKLLVTAYQSSVNSRNVILASQLAQEGYEMVRNIRDNNLAISGAGHAFDNLDTASNAKRCPRAFNYFPVDARVMDCAVAGDYRLYMNNAVHVYTYAQNAGYTKTLFSRKVTIDATNPNLRVVRSVVVWGTKSVDVIEALAGGVPSNCNIGNKCVYTEGILSSTGWQ